MANKALRKFKFERRVGRTVVNPLVAAMDRIGIRSSLVVELETTGAKTGQPKSTLERQIDENLRRVYQQTLSEVVPDRLLQLVQQLKRESDAKGASK